MTLTAPIIKSKELNNEFGEFKSTGLAQDTAGNLDTGLTASLRYVNQSDANHSNINLNWNYIYFTAAGNETYDTERNNLYYRASDDVQILGVIPDLWGVDRIGYNADAAVVRPSDRLLVRLTVLGNFTALDEEEGLPVTYKSSEFNLIKDIDMVFDFTDAGVLARLESSAALNPINTLGPNFVSGRGALTSVSTLDGFPRKLYYPLDPEEPLFTLLRGAQYIFTISFQDFNGVTLADASGALANHPITSVQMSLVARHFRRRYA